MRILMVAAAVAAALCWLAAKAGATPVVDIPVSFQVENTNTSGSPCTFPSDGGKYTVRGHISAPRAALATRAITVYLTGLDTGEWNWRFRSVRGYDWPAEMAKLGQASLTVDMLGYGTNCPPPRTHLCHGA